MIRLNIEDLQGGEILARPLMTWDYQIVLPEGAVIRKDYIDKLSELGILEVFIKEKEQSNEIVILKSEIKDSVIEKVKDILERHTYRKNNEELEKLCETADNIICTILEEDKVVEKIFDIKERSTDIYEHSISICSLAILTALKMQLDEKTIHDIGVGCLLHDIGLRYTTIDFTKADVETLNPKELMEYKKHPVYGYSSLRDQDWISNISKNIILYHHERLDGSGFPLRTREIPIECRIVNVCDAFDEMICGITRKQIKVYEAIEYLKGFKNVLFDAKIVDIFLDFTAVYPAGTHVVTNEGELAVVVSQNKNFQDRPVIRILRDKDGNDVKEERLKDLLKIHNIFIDKVLD